MTEEDYQKLQEKVQELKMKYLFEEPCPLYEDEEEEWSEFFNFVSSVLYLYIAWMSGIFLGYIISERNRGD